MKRHRESVKRKLFIISVILFLLLFLVVNAAVFLRPQDEILDSSIHQPPRPEQIPVEEENKKEYVAYVINQLSDDVSVLDLSSLEVIGTIKTGSYPTGAFLDEGKLYVSNGGDGTVSIIDTLSHKQKTLRIGNALQDGIVMNKKVYVSVKDKDMIRIIDPITQVIEEIPNIDSPTDMITDGTMIYVLSEAEGEVVMINPALDKIAKKIDVGARPKSMALSKEKQFLFVTNTGDDTLSVIPTKLLKETITIPVSAEPAGIAAMPDEKFIFVASTETNQLDVISLIKEQKVGIVEVGLGPVAIERRGNTLLVANYVGQTISVIDINKLKEIASIKVGLGPVAMVVGEKQ